MVRMMLIGKGGNGLVNIGLQSNTGGGGSGAITTWIGPAIFIPDTLRISINSTSTDVIYQQKSTTGYTLLTANAGANANVNVGGTGGAAMTNNYFGAAGIFSSTAGQNGATAPGSITASTTTPLSGGAGGGSNTAVAGGNVASKYGYPSLTGGVGTTGGNGANGYTLTQPLFFAMGGSGGGGDSTSGKGGDGGNGGLGCGGGGAGRASAGTSYGGTGGPGAVFIWAW